MAVPSVSNTAGNVAGLAAVLTSTSVASAVAATAPFIYMSMATGIPPLIFASAVLGVGSMGVNYLVTHWAEGKVIENDFDKWWPMISAMLSIKNYGVGVIAKNGDTTIQPVSQGQDNANINRP